jgi:hypothetical protein
MAGATKICPRRLVHCPGECGRETTAEMAIIDLSPALPAEHGWAVVEYDLAVWSFAHAAK